MKINIILSVGFILLISTATFCQSIWNISSMSGYDQTYSPNDLLTLDNGDIYLTSSRYDNTVGGFVNKLYKSSDQGNTWSEISTSGLTDLGNTHSLAFSNNTLVLAGMDVNSANGAKIFLSQLETKIINLSGNLNFGDVEIGNSSQRTMLIENSGNSTFTVSDITFPDDGYSGDWSGGTISADQHQEVNITFTPTHEQTYLGTITVNSDATSGTNTIDVTGKGIIAPTRIIALTGNLNFGDVEIGNSSQRTMLIENSGNSTLTVSGITFPDGYSVTGLEAP
jgi:hypothetical protein